ncbi:nitric oxide synthase-interacting protein homolog [Anthonomus grandis grandis]|uniref:nitric oxide synthase-interacting protein homolog n=1 Tax=Anthonomus grandis grandis TaxID=2921223 RepID=UPI0021653B55|nr:nitric oxide synthase-interacting protein homolog [Anthonomus grandis grandis]
MTRHARNCTAGAVYTYHEKKKDAQASGYGTNSQRLGKDSIKNFDCCSLSLQPCRNPVITKDGYLFDKEVILEYIIAKKNEYSKQLKQYEKMKKKEDEEINNKKTSELEKKVESFLKNENNIVSKPLDGFKSEPSTSSISNMANGKEKVLPSFWVPGQTAQVEKSKLQKPDPTIYCPVSGKPLKVKDLVDVKFTAVKDDSKKSIHTQENRYMCAVTHDILSNSIPCAVLRPTGDVVTVECVEKLIKKDMMHPLTSKKLSEKDIIIMQRGGTGYALTNEKLEAKAERPALQA